MPRSVRGVAAALPARRAVDGLAAAAVLLGFGLTVPVLAFGLAAEAFAAAAFAGFEAFTAFAAPRAAGLPAGSSGLTELIPDPGDEGVAAGDSTAATASAASSCAGAAPIVLERVRWHVSQVTIARTRPPSRCSSRRSVRLWLQKGQ